MKTLLTLLLICFPAAAFADVSIELAPLREYSIPSDGFELAGAQIQMGSDGTTVISNSAGSDSTATCTILVAGDDAATSFSYQNNGAPTACVDVLAHPEGGVFIRGFDPSVDDGSVTGFTARIGADGSELWKVSDQLLVDAAPKPAGTGEFIGSYHVATSPMGYSAELDKLLAFTAGKLTIGADEKFITQGHIIGGESGVLTVSGQTFGQSGVGFVSDILVRDDGEFIVHLYTPGSRGANFFNYDGRQNISFFNPMDEAWDLRYVTKMAYGDRAVHMLWQESDDPNATSHFTVTNDEGAMFFNNEYESLYQFANGSTLAVGPATDMWLGADYVVISHVNDGQIYLRFVDTNGTSPGMASLNSYSPGPPAAIVNGPNGTLRLLVFDENDRKITEYDMTFEEVSNYDPDAGLGDTGFSPDVGLGDVIERVTGCGCRTISANPTQPLSFWMFAILGFAIRRRYSG